MFLLSEAEARIIGSLIEKENTTPEYYPLTLNGLMLACNQKSNREPVVQYSERFIDEQVEKLWDKKYICRVTSTEMRVPKFKQIFTAAYQFTKPETAIICVLLLRGPQTLGELKNRAARIHEFTDLAEVDATLLGLISTDEPKVTKLPKQPGKDPRYAHLFCGTPVFEEPAAVTVKNDKDRLADLEAEVKLLKEILTDIQNQFAEFKRQFE